MFKRSFRTSVIALGLLAAANGWAQTPLKIGFLATLSGPLGTLGQDQYDGFMLAIEERGGKLGGTPVQVLKEDDQFKPEVALQIVQKLIERDNVSVITGMTGSNVIMAVASTSSTRRFF